MILSWERWGGDLFLGFPSGGDSMRSSIVFLWTVSKGYFSGGLGDVENAVHVGWYYGINSRETVEKGNGMVIEWCAWQESNLRPADSKSDALSY